MLYIFSEVSAIEEIYVSEDYPNWQKVIGNQANIYLNIDQPTLDSEMEGDDAEESLLFLWYHENDAAIKPQALGAQFQFVDNEQTIIDQPLGIFILDIDEARANELGTKYGIQVYSSHKLADIKDFELDFDFEENDSVQCDDGKLKGYDFVLKEFKSEKSNSTIIVDRNLFTNQERMLNVGVDNMIRYFSSVLPAKLETTYDILLVTEISLKREDEILRPKIIIDITRSIQQLRDYPINVEILFVHASTEHFKNTHERRILKNYHFGHSEHGFAIFSIKNKEKVRNDNNFNLQVQYHSLLNEKSENVSLKKHNKLYKRLLEIKADAEKQLKTQGQNDRYYRLFLNGTESSEITNRLLH